MNVQEQLKHVPTKLWQDVVAKYSRLSEYERALDIGTASGLSSWSIAMNGTGTIISLDPHFKDTPRLLAKEYNYTDRIVFLTITSDDFFKDYDGEPFDLVIIDGDHEYQPVMNDLLNSWKHTRMGGFIVCDDYAHPKLRFCVGKAVDDFARRFNLKIHIINGKAVLIKNIDLMA